MSFLYDSPHYTEGLASTLNIKTRTPVQIIYEDIVVNADGEDGESDEELDDFENLPARVQFSNMSINDEKPTGTAV